MNEQSASQESYRTFQLMSELEAGATISQRELAARLGVAVGLVNSYLKNFVAKGYVRVKAFPRNRYAYLLTPKGFAEKGRLAFQHLSYFTSLYTATRQEYLSLFLRLKASGVEAVIFCGVDEVAEIAYLSLQEAGLRLEMVVDAPSSCDGKLFGIQVQALGAVSPSIGIPIILTSLKRSHLLKELLLERNLSTATHMPAALLLGRIPSPASD